MNDLKKGIIIKLFFLCFLALTTNKDLMRPFFDHVVLCFRFVKCRSTVNPSTFKVVHLTQNSFDDWLFFEKYERKASGYIWLLAFDYINLWNCAKFREIITDWLFIAWRTLSADEHLMLCGSWRHFIEFAVGILLKYNGLLFSM